MIIFISSNHLVNAEGKIDAGCAYNGIQLYGKVQIVEDFPDITVKQVDDFADLHVKKVEDFADECGKWKIVDEFADFKVKLVDDFEDITVKMVCNSDKL
ncbi:MAG: hypothetical protein ACHBN1_10770 [Heteroscytonema crispum UTEX LB 1556]